MLNYKRFGFSQGFFLAKFSRERFHLFVAWIIHTLVFLSICFPVIFVLLMLVCIVSGRWEQSTTAFLCSLQVVVSTPSSVLASPLTPLFGAYSLSTSVLECKALSFLVGVLLSSTLADRQLFWWNFCYLVWFRVVFLVLVRLLFFFPFRMFKDVLFQFSLVFVGFHFSERSDFILI